MEAEKCQMGNPISILGISEDMIQRCKAKLSYESESVRQRVMIVKSDISSFHIINSLIW